MRSYALVEDTYFDIAFAVKKTLTCLLACTLAAYITIFSGESRQIGIGAATTVMVLFGGTMPVFAFHRGSNATLDSPQCPFGTLTGDVDNGCSLSPGGSTAHTDFFNGFANRSGQVYASRPQRNQVGIDFLGGAPLLSDGVSVCGQDHLADPAAPNASGCGSMPVNCAFFLTGVVGRSSGPTIYCNFAPGPIIQGFNLGTIGGHGATVLIFQKNGTGTPIVRYNIQICDDSCYANSGLSVVNSDSRDYIIYANTFDGNWDNYGSGASFTASQAGTTLTVTAVSSGKPGLNQKLQACSGCPTALASNTYIAAVGTVLPDGTGTYTVTTSKTVASENMDGSRQWNPININTTGKVTATYNVFRQVNGRPMAGIVNGSPSIANGTSGEQFFGYNYMEDIVMDVRGGTVHGEMWEGQMNSGSQNTTIPKVTYIGNTVLQTEKAAANGTTAPFYISTGQPNGQVAGATNQVLQNFITNNVVVINTPTGGGSSTSVALAEYSYMQYVETYIRGNWVDKTGALYNTLCTGAPYTSGGYDSSKAAFTTVVSISDNHNLAANGASIDSTLLTGSELYQCARAV